MNYEVITEHEPGLNLRDSLIKTATYFKDWIRQAIVATKTKGDVNTLTIVDNLHHRDNDVAIH